MSSFASYIAGLAVWLLHTHTLRWLCSNDISCSYNLNIIWKVKRQLYKAKLSTMGMQLLLSCPWRLFGAFQMIIFTQLFEWDTALEDVWQLSINLHLLKYHLGQFWKPEMFKCKKFSKCWLTINDQTAHNPCRYIIAILLTTEIKCLVAPYRKLQLISHHWFFSLLHFCSLNSVHQCNITTAEVSNSPDPAVGLLKINHQKCAF